MEEGPRRMLGVDYGGRRIGLAVSEGAVAVPLSVVEHESRESDLARVAAMAREREVDAVVIGLPLLPSGDEGAQARRARRFGEALARRVDVPVVFHDELLSTASAEVAMREAAGRKRRRARVDDRAAAVILQSYIDEQATGSRAL